MRAQIRTDAARRLSQCMGALLRDQPYFATLALRLNLRPDPSRSTLASDGHTIRYAPEWILDTPAELIKTAIARVVLACSLKHHTRRADRDPIRWQLASQLVTHGIIEDSGFVLPDGAEAWRDLSVEQAYDRLPPPDPEPPQPQPSPAPPPPSPSSGASSANPPPNQPPNPGEPGAGSSVPQPDPAPDNDNPSHDPSGTGEVIDAPNRSGPDDSPLNIQTEEQSWDEAIHQAANIARARGLLPGVIEELLRTLHTSAVDWRSVLRHYMTAPARQDYSWSSPNRRFIHSGLYLPSIRSYGIGDIAIIIDTSGSLPSDVLSQFWTEVREIASEVQPDRITLLQVDAVLQDAREYLSTDLPDEIEIKGRGGTDFRPGFAWLDEHGHRPTCCLYLTDMMCCDYPEAPPDYPVLWCNWGPVPRDTAPRTMGRTHRHRHRPNPGLNRGLKSQGTPGQSAPDPQPCLPPGNPSPLTDPTRPEPKTTPMLSLPDNAAFAFCPAYDMPLDETQQIRIVFEGMTGYIATNLTTASIDDAERLCDNLNARLRHTRDDWQRLVAASMARQPHLFH